MKHRGTVLLVLLIIGIFLVVLTQKGKPPERPSVAVGLEAPSFVVFDRQGNEYSSETLRGKTVFLHFWASWCRECQKEMPEIVRLYERKKQDPEFVMLAVVYNEDPVVSMKYLKKQGYNIPLFVDPDGKAASAFGVTGVPETYIIGPDGIVKDKVIGPGRWDQYRF